MFSSVGDNDVYNFDIDAYDSKPKTNSNHSKNNIASSSSTKPTTTTSNEPVDALAKAKAMLNKYSGNNINKVSSIKPSMKTFDEDDLSLDADDDDTSFLESGESSFAQQKILSSKVNAVDAANYSGSYQDSSNPTDFFAEDFTNDYSSHAAYNPPARAPNPLQFNRSVSDAVEVEVIDESYVGTEELNDEYDSSFDDVSKPSPYFNAQPMSQPMIQTSSQLLSSINRDDYDDEDEDVGGRRNKIMTFAGMCTTQ
jgi:hypothetical protein